MSVWPVLIGMALVTFALRASFLVLPPGIETPPLLRRAPARFRIDAGPAGGMRPEGITLEHPDLLFVHMARAARVPDAPDPGRMPE